MPKAPTPGIAPAAEPAPAAVVLASGSAAERWLGAHNGSSAARTIAAASAGRIARSRYSPSPNGDNVNVRRS